MTIFLRLTFSVFVVATCVAWINLPGGWWHGHLAASAAVALFLESMVSK